MADPQVFNKHHRSAPPDSVYIGRGSPFGNPFLIGEDGDRDRVCDLYQEAVEADPVFKAYAVEFLKGKNLVCFCKPLRCHGDYLLKIANERPTPWTK